MAPASASTSGQIDDPWGAGTYFPTRDRRHGRVHVELVGDRTEGGVPALGGDLAHGVATAAVEPLELRVAGERRLDQSGDDLVVVEERRRDAAGHELRADDRQREVERVGAQVGDGC